MFITVHARNIGPLYINPAQIVRIEKGERYRDENGNEKHFSIIHYDSFRLFPSLMGDISERQSRVFTVLESPEEISDLIELAKRNGGFSGNESHGVSLSPAEDGELIDSARINGNRHA